MFCINCGAKLNAGDAHCGECGTNTVPAAAPAGSQNFAIGVTESSAFRGFLVLVSTWFMMPIATMKLAMRLLREIGDRGVMDNSDDWPHLNWWRVAAPFMATVVFILICIFGLFAFIKAIQMSSYVPGLWGILGPFLILLGTYLFAIAVDWAIMVMGEVIAIRVSNANNLKAIAANTTKK